MEEKPSVCEQIKEVFRTCTRGFEAKVINLVCYALFQIAVDFTVFQFMVRYWISEWTGTAEGLDMSQEIVPTLFNVICLALISSFTLTGSILAIYYDRKGTVLLFISQIASIAFAIVYFSVPMASHTVNEYCNYDASLDSNAFYGIFIWITCLFKCFGYFIPIFIVLWFIYCTIAIGIALSGHHVFVNQPNFNKTGFELISTDEQEEMLA